MFTGGALIFIMSLLRIFVVRLQETPKYLISKGRDEELVALLQGIATRYNRPLSLTLEQLQACGTIQEVEKIAGQSKISRFGKELAIHVQGLFATRKIGFSTVLVWFSWTLIGMGYPLFFIYLP